MVGELKCHLRDSSWRLHVPRRLKEQALRLCRAAEELHQRLGRAPTAAELAEQLELGEEEVLDQSILVLTGITTREEAQRFPFLPTRIVDSVADLVDDIDDEPRPAGLPPARRRLDRQAAADHVGASAPNGQPPVPAANAS